MTMQEKRARAEVRAQSDFAPRGAKPGKAAPSRDSGAERRGGSQSTSRSRGAAGSTLTTRPSRSSASRGDGAGRGATPSRDGRPPRDTLSTGRTRSPRDSRSTRDARLPRREELRDGGDTRDTRDRDTRDRDTRDRQDIPSARGRGDGATNTRPRRDGNDIRDTWTSRTRDERSSRPGGSDRDHRAARPATRTPSDRRSTGDRFGNAKSGNGRGARSSSASRDNWQPPYGVSEEPSAYAPDEFVNVTAEQSDVENFGELGVHEDLVQVLRTQGITTPFPIQVATLPQAIAGRDVLGRGQTGSGKTLAFGLAILTQLAFRKPAAGQPYALVLSPTRELAMQIEEALQPLAKAVRIRTQVVAGGMSYDKQIRAIEQGAHIVIATPGRLIDLLNRAVIDLSRVQTAVLDEADQMADMGFLPDVRTILDQVRAGGQRLLFSATLDKGVDTIIDTYMNEPTVHAVDSGQASVTSMNHHILVLNPKEKDDILCQIGARRGRTIMFVRSQLGGDRVGELLAHSGVPVGVLHGGKTQRVRNRTLAAFKEDPNAVLIATDVAARGIHVDDVSLVVNVDTPNNSKDYLHRAGRTARAGESGAVVTLTTTRHRAHVLSLLKKAGVDAAPVYVKPLDDELVEVTGARKPSGIPWTPPPVEPDRPSRQSRGGRGRRDGDARGSGRKPGRSGARSGEASRSGGGSAGGKSSGSGGTVRTESGRPRG